ncbi:MAG: TonB-dependent receptor [Cytophagales bacterium]|nr:TonB-dependent receptor [Cytophagales bacterium]
MLKQSFVFFALFLLASVGFGQTHTLKGTVYEEGTNEPLVNATIRIKNSDIGAVTDPKGRFSLVMNPGIYDMVISSVGFTTIEEKVEVTSDMERSFQVKESLLALPEFIVETNTLSAGRQGIRDIAGSVQYLDSKKLEEQRYSNVNDILKQVPGVNVQEEDGFGLRPNIGLRGSGSERSSKITLMEDGILAAPAPYAAPSAYYFPTVGRMGGVEVLKGSSQVRFGPFTSGGAINFLSTPIPTYQSMFLGMTVGSFGYANVHTYLGDKKENFGYLVETYQYGSSGFKQVPNGDTGFRKADYNAKFTVNTTPEVRNYQSLTFAIGRTVEDSDETYLGLTQEDFDQDPYRRYAASQVDNMDAEQNRFSIQHYLEMPKLFKVVTTAYRNTFRRNWYKLHSVGGESLSAVLEDPTSFSDEFDLLTGMSSSTLGDLIVRANNRTYVAKGVQTTFDVEFETGTVSHDIHISTRIHQDKEDRFQFQDGYAMEDQVMKLVDKGVPGSNANRIEKADAVASFIFYKIKVGNWRFTPGIRNENVKVSRKDFGKIDPTRGGTDLATRSNHFSAWLPGVGVNYLLGEKMSFFGGLHKGFAPGGSVEGVEPEESINYEVGVRSNGSKFSASTIFFVNNYQNLLGADNASAGGSGSGEMFNAGEALTQGVEVELSYNVPGLAQKIALPISVAYTFTDSHFNTSFESGFEGWGSVADGDQIPYLARNQLYVSASLKTKKYSFSVNGKYQSEQRTTPGTGEIMPTDRIDAFFTADASLNYFLDGRTTFFGSVTNIANTEYAVARRPAGLRPGMPRSFRLGISVRF